MTLRERLRKLEGKQKPDRYDPFVIYLSSEPHWKDISSEEKARVEQEITRIIADGLARKSEVICCGVPNGYPGIKG